MKKMKMKKYFNEIVKSISTIDDWRNDDYSGLVSVASFSAHPIKGKRLSYLVGVPGVFADHWEADGLMTSAVEAVIKSTVGGGPVSRTFGGLPRFNPSGRYVIDVSPPGSGWGYHFRRVA